MKKISPTIIVVILVFILSHCSPTKSSSDQQQKEQFQVAQDSIDRLVKATEEKFRKMSSEELMVELEKGSVQGREPFNSPAFREAIKRESIAAELVKSISDSTQKEYFKLMALKKVSANDYRKINSRTGAAILTDALAKSETFNAWGIPNTYWESSARAIIEYGSVSTPYLVKLLGDKRPAPVWGSEEVMIYQKYKFRVCDYALALINAIDQNDKVQLPISPEKRDSIIVNYQKKRN